MKKLMFVIVVGAFFACNSPEQNSTTGNSQDSLTVGGGDSTSGASGQQGTGTDNTGGTTSGTGSLSDTTHNRVDTAGHKAGKQ